MHRVFGTGYFSMCKPVAEETRDGIKLTLQVPCPALPCPACDTLAPTYWQGLPCHAMPWLCHAMPCHAMT